MSERKRATRVETSSPSAKKQRTLLTPDQKGEIYQFYLTFRERTAVTRSARKKNEKRHHNDSSVTESHRYRPSQYRTVGLSTWKKVIAAGKDGGVWRKAGGQTTLNEGEEKSLAAHIKEVGTKGHLVTNNAIVYWALQILARSPRFPLPKEEDSEEVKQKLLEAKVRAVSKIGGKRWLSAFKARHDIKLHRNQKGLEEIRAKKTQPENYVQFYKKLLKVHGMAQIHEVVRNARAYETALLFEDIVPGVNSKWPSAPLECKDWPKEADLLADIRQIPGLQKWEPGLVDMTEDFFFNLH